jgi:biotin carboxyl carrier protein
VTLDGRTVAVTVNGRRMRRRGAERASDVDGEQEILAPMPGRVVRILAAPGDLVAARQPVIVVEAMKMENELRSPKSGRVKQVAVAEGMSVESGRVLIVIE